MRLARLGFAATIAVLATILAACGSAPDADAGAGTDAGREAILSADREFSKLSEAQGTVAAFMHFLTDDAVLLPHGEAPVKGSDAIYEVLSADSDYILSWEPQDAEVAASGELGYSWGIYRLRAQDSGAGGVVGYGKYLSVWRKQADGEWRVIADIGNQTPGPDGGG
ncbi:MAG: DUF4440 domain-containing protein [Gammaproteobacteria bacterium]|nr:DUF4440 domain-containing protein [Gammaproteobacteria bacterium]